MTEIRDTLTQERFEQVSGEFRRVYSWRQDEHGQYEPIMVIYRTHFPTHMPFGVPLNSAYRFDNAHHLMQCAIAALDHFGMITTKDSAVKLATVIQDGLDDLIRMPPRPETRDFKRSDPDAILSINGKENAVWA